MRLTLARKKLANATSTKIPSYIALPRIRPMKRYQFRLCAAERREWGQSDSDSRGGRAKLTFGGIGMRIGVQFVLLIRQPEPPIRIKHLLTQIREELFENSTTVDTRSADKRSAKNENRR